MSMVLTTCCSTFIKGLLKIVASFHFCERGLHRLNHHPVFAAPLATLLVDNSLFPFEIGPCRPQLHDLPTDLNENVMVRVPAVLRPDIAEAQLPENRRLALSFQDQKQGGFRCLVTLPCLLHYSEQPSRLPLPLNPGKLEEPLAMLALQPLLVVPGRISENYPHHHFVSRATSNAAVLNAYRQ